jgi:glycosyltransferase involved in cell wall biosynthesis
VGQNAFSAVALIIPALNEAEALRELLPALIPYQPGWTIVVDNGSTDETAAVARAAGALVIVESQRGYGRACWRGFQTACELGAEFLVFLDGDGSDDPDDLPLLLAPLLKGDADLVIGSRVGSRSERGAIPPQARLGNWLVSRSLGLFYGIPLHDVGSFRALRSSTLDRLHMREMTFGWPVEMLTKAARTGYRITEVDMHYRHRSHGHSKVAGTFTGSLKAAFHMVRTTLRYTRLGGRYV